MSSLDAGGGFLPLQQEPQRRKLQGIVVQDGAHATSVSGWLKIETSQYPWRCQRDHGCGFRTVGENLLLIRC